MERKKGFRFSPDCKRTALGCGAGIVTLLVVVAIGAGLLDREVVALASIRWCAVTALLAAGFVAARTSGTLPEAALALTGMTVVLGALNLGLFDGKMEGFAASILVLLGGGGAALLLRGRGKRRTGSRGRRKTVKLTKSHVR